MKSVKCLLDQPFGIFLGCAVAAGLSSAKITWSANAALHVVQSPN
jgi:hypothetical protein